MNEAGENTAAPDHTLTAEFKKRLLSFLAQKLSFSLFAPGREDALRQAISRLVAARLVEENIMLKSHEEKELVDELIAGLPRRNTIVPDPTPPAAEKKVWNVESLRAHVAPYIAEHTGNHLYQPGREAQLSEAVFMLVRQKISSDELDVSDELVRQLIETICSSMAIPLPSALNPGLPPPVKAETPPPPPMPPAEPGATGPKADTRKLEVTSADWQPLTEQSRRLILLYMGSRIKPEILARGNPSAAQIHVAELLGAAVTEYTVRLTEEQREEIMATILSGEGVEFQL